MHDTREVELDQALAVSAPPATLYRFFDADGVLLYIGITERGAMRWEDHREEKHWWPAVTSCTLEHFESRLEVEAAERSAIKTERPRFNTNHNRPGQRPRRRLTGEFPEEELRANAKLRAEAMAERDRLIMEALAAGATKRRIGALAGMTGPGVLDVEKRMNGQIRHHDKRRR